MLITKHKMVLTIWFAPPYISQHSRIRLGRYGFMCFALPRGTCICPYCSAASDWVSMILSFAFEVKTHNVSNSFVNLCSHLDYSNTKWDFLDVVKRPGALTRHMIIKKCIDDMQILQALCGYVSAAGFSSLLKGYFMNAQDHQIVFSLGRYIRLGLKSMRLLKPSSLSPWQLL